MLLERIALVGLLGLAAATALALAPSMDGPAYATTHGMREGPGRAVSWSRPGN
jgi:hypothetical protein